MTYDPTHHHRRSIRLREFDYGSAGAYYITVCVEGRQCIFGHVVDGAMQLNDRGRMIETVWTEIPAHYPGVELDEFVVMPTPVHAIIVFPALPADGAEKPIGQPRMGQPRGVAPTGDVPHIPYGRAPVPAPADPDDSNVPTRPVGAGPRACPPATRLSAPDVVHRFKSLTTTRYRHGVRDLGWARFPGRLWQRNYFEHIIRDDEDLTRIREYIALNPAKWAEDQENPDGAPPDEPNVPTAQPPNDSIVPTATVECAATHNARPTEQPTTVGAGPRACPPITGPRACPPITPRKT